MNGILLQGNALHLPLADNSVHCVVTSPPYYGLRDYGTGYWEGGDPTCEHSRGGHGQAPQTKHPGAALVITSGGNRGAKNVCVKCGATLVDEQIGLEENPQAYIERLVAVFREVRRVLRPDGTCWVNLGDTYGANFRWGGATNQDSKQWSNAGTRVFQKPAEGFIGKKRRLMIPARLAIALQDDDWIIRSEIVWHKPGPMPGSYRDRPTDAHEMVYMLTKQSSYWSDFDALRTPIKDESAARLLWGIGDNHKNVDGAPGQCPHSMSRPRAHHGKFVGTNYGGDSAKLRGHSGNYDADGQPTGHPLGANIRTVWSITNAGFAGAHYATFPPELARRCIVAGCPEKTCPKCGKGWVREAEVSGGAIGQAWSDHENDLALGNRASRPEAKGGHGYVRLDLGFHSSCTCGCEGAVSGVVLDPFMGSGTTALVARQQGRRYVGVELSAVYNALAAERLRLPFEPHHVKPAIEPLRSIDYSNGEVQPPLFQLEE